MSGTQTNLVSPFYVSTSFWNTPIAPAAQPAPNSSAIMAESILPYSQSAIFANGPDWGIGLAYATPGEGAYTIQNIKLFNNGPVSFPIPPNSHPGTGSDHHLVVIDGTQELDLWDASYNTATDTWSAGSAFVENIDGWGANASPGLVTGGIYAAGFSGMGGVVRPEEIAQGHIDHALSLAVPVTLAGYIAPPATNTDGTSTNPNAIPEGAHVRLDPSFNVDAQNWPTWEKVIAKALQTYGAYVSDTGGSPMIYGQTDSNGGMSWTQAGVPEDASLSNLPWQNMQVLALPPDATSTTAAITVQTVQANSGNPDMEIALLYKAALNRFPAPAELASWKAPLASGVTTLQQIAQQFIASPEFQQKYGNPGPAAFITDIYQNALGRLPDPTGSQAWSQILAANPSSGQGAALLDISQSQESLNFSGPSIVQGGLLSV